MFNDTQNNITGRARIKVIGVGGAGNNAVNRMINANITSAEYIVVNTDSQILSLSPCENKIQIGRSLTKGLGAGADPEVGRAAAEETKDELTEAIKGTDLLFITAGMGGGTGTGAAPVIAKIARDMKILTVAFVTEPFDFEGRTRKENTIKGLEQLKKYVDSIVVIPNDKIKTVVAKNTPVNEAFRVADEILKQGIKGLSELIVNPSLINLDFADVKTILKDKGIAHLGVGVAKGDNRIVEAVRVAVNCPLLETTIEGARSVILNIVGGNDLSFDEINEACELVKSVVDASANIIFGARVDPNIQEEVQITVIATDFPGYEKDNKEERRTSNTYNQPNYSVSDPFYYAQQGRVQPMPQMTGMQQPMYQQPMPGYYQQPMPQMTGMQQSMPPVQNIPQATQPVQEEQPIERPTEKDIPVFARILHNLGKKK